MSQQLQKLRGETHLLLRKWGVSWFIVMLFIIAQDWKQPKCPTIGDCLNKALLGWNTTQQQKGGKSSSRAAQESPGYINRRKQDAKEWAYHMLTFMGEEWSETVIHIHVAIRKAELWKDPGTGTGWGAASGRAVRWLGKASLRYHLNGYLKERREQLVSQPWLRKSRGALSNLKEAPRSGSILRSGVNDIAKGSTV